MLSTEDMIEQVEMKMEKNDISKTLDELVYKLISSPKRGMLNETLDLFRDTFKSNFMMGAAQQKALKKQSYAKALPYEERDDYCLVRPVPDDFEENLPTAFDEESNKEIGQLILDIGRKARSGNYTVVNGKLISRTNNNYKVYQLPFTYEVDGKSVRTMTIDSKALDTQYWGLARLMCSRTQIS